MENYYFTDLFCKQNGIQILYNERVIFPRDVDSKINYEFVPSLPRIKMDENARKDIKTMKIYLCEDLRARDIYLVSVNVTKRWFKGQRTKLILCHKNNIPLNSTVYSSMPDNHHVQYDLINERYRLVGRNSGKLGMGEWTE